jgi:hypothetical protein
MTGLIVDDLRRFGRDGFLIIRGLIPPADVAAANEVIDTMIAAEPSPGAGQRSYVEKGSEMNPALLGLLTRTDAYAMAEQLAVPGGLVGPSHVQVALTFPPYQHIPGSGHIDGLSEVKPDGRPNSFTLLVGVILSDQSADNMGNLHVWPGTHIATAEFARTHGMAALLAGAAATSSPPVPQENRMQLHGQPGDVVFAHYLLAHNIGGNTSTVVRRSVYLRLKRVGHEQHWAQALTDPFYEYDGVRAAIAGT